MNTTHHVTLTLGAALLVGCATSSAPTAPDPASDVDKTANIAPEPAAPAGRQLLTPEAVGAFTVSGTLDAFDDEAGFGEEVLAEGVIAIAVAIPEVCAIQVMSPRFVTDEGLSVDSSAGQWEAAFGALTYDGDTGLYEPGASGYGLILDTESEPPEPDADVIAIRVGRCPI